MHALALQSSIAYSTDSSTALPRATTRLLVLVVVVEVVLLFEVVVKVARPADRSVGTAGFL